MPTCLDEKGHLPHWIQIGSKFPHCPPDRLHITCLKKSKQYCCLQYGIVKIRKERQQIIGFVFFFRSRWWFKKWWRKWYTIFASQKNTFQGWSQWPFCRKRKYFIANCTLINLHWVNPPKCVICVSAWASRDVLKPHTGFSKPNPQILCLSHFVLLAYEWDLELKICSKCRTVDTLALTLHFIKPSRSKWILSVRCQRTPPKEADHSFLLRLLPSMDFI